MTSELSSGIPANSAIGISAVNYVDIVFVEVGL